MRGNNLRLHHRAAEHYKNIDFLGPLALPVLLKSYLCPTLFLNFLVFPPLKKIPVLLCPTFDLSTKIKKMQIDIDTAVSGIYPVITECEIFCQNKSQ